MTGTLNPACPLCGLRFAGRPLLELHIREDHPRRGRRAQPGRGDPGGTRATSARADSPAHRYGLAPGPSRTTKEVKAMTAIRHPRARRVRAIPRRAIRALRYVNDELVRALEALMRPAGASRSRPRAEAPANGHPRSGIPAEHADRAA